MKAANPRTGSQQQTTGHCTTVQASRDAVTFAKVDPAERFLKGKLPTSLDGMSPNNPGLLALADIPVMPRIKVHSIIPVLGDGNPQKGRDGVVAYTSAHVNYVESELVVRGEHSCQNLSVTIEEVRRILHKHLEASDSQSDGSRSGLEKRQ